jgi:hypothetical protein
MRLAGPMTTAVAVTLAWFAAGSVELATQAPPPNLPTFSKDVAPILYNRCVSCHRPGEAAPMSLISYQETRPWASSIRRMVVNRLMPPWTADPQFGHFRGDARLSDAEIETITLWSNSGAREGDPKDLPKLPQFTEGWQIGKPDIVFEMPVAFDIPASGIIPLQSFDVPTNFKEDVWVQAAEARYGDAPHVHHIVVSVIPPPERAKREASVIDIQSIQLPGQETAERPRRAPRPAQNAAPSDGGLPTAGGMIALPLVNKALGEEPPVFPEGTGRLIPAGSTIRFGMHYTSNGVPGQDRSKVGLILAKNRPLKEVRQTAVTNNLFVIPPGDPNYEVIGEGTFKANVKVLSVHGHMHLRGKDMTYVVTYPDGRSETIFRIPRWDYLWQQEFWLKEPLALPKGSKLRVIAHFDNSAANPLNPDPKARLTWGDQTWDEMMGGFIQYIIDDDAPAPAVGAGAH